MLPPMIKGSLLTNLDPGMAKDLLQAETGTFSYLVNLKYTIKPSLMSREQETDRYK